MHNLWRFFTSLLTIEKQLIPSAFVTWDDKANLKSDFTVVGTRVLCVRVGATHGAGSSLEADHEVSHCTETELRDCFQRDLTIGARGEKAEKGKLGVEAEGESEGVKA